MFLEGLLLARGLEHAWVELFLRHWISQSRLLYQRDVTRGLSEVIDLLDFAHGERAAGCPQSVCVAQDVCIAYGVVDGPGFGEERLAAAAEGLDRIDPSWPCFRCLSTEYADALLDLQRHAEAEAYCRTQLARCAGGSDELRSSLARALAGQERPQEALDVLERGTYNTSSLMRQGTQLLRCQLLIKLGRLPEGLRHWRSTRKLEVANFLEWARCASLICERMPERNHGALEAELQRFVHALQANGALYEQAEIALIAGRLAKQRGDLPCARDWLARLDLLLPQLRRPQVLQPALEVLRGALLQSQ
jgi:tetratricopeptide (TPR) repeat protein